MAYTETSDTKKTVLTWTSPNGGTSKAVIVDGVVTELFVEGQNNSSVVFTTNKADLEHLNTVLADIINFLKPS